MTSHNQLLRLKRKHSQAWRNADRILNRVHPNRNEWPRRAKYWIRQANGYWMKMAAMGHVVMWPITSPSPPLSRQSTLVP